MKRQMDEHLNLDQLLARGKELDPDIMIRIYYDPQVFLFYINHEGILPFWLPSKSFYIGECRADALRFCIELYISNAVRKSTKPVKI